jgi:hypothetical protein
LDDANGAVAEEEIYAERVPAIRILDVIERIIGNPSVSGPSGVGEDEDGRTFHFVMGYDGRDTEHSSQYEYYFDRVRRTVVLSVGGSPVEL